MVRYLALVMLLALTAYAGAEVEVITPDGRRVLLKDDHTWEYLDSQGQPEQEDEERLLLSVTNRAPSGNGCTFGLRLQNQTGDELRSLVPQFSAYKVGDIRFQTVFKGFTGVKPTTEQYQEVEFSGISCEEIAYIGVSGGDRCSIGELTKFSPVKGVCLEMVEIEPSEVIPMRKRSGEEPGGT